MKTKYVWKVLSEDGLLKEPHYKVRGGYDESLNGHYGGYDTEFEAQEALVSARQTAIAYTLPRQLVMIKVIDGRVGSPWV